MTDVSGAEASTLSFKGIKVRKGLSQRSHVSKRIHYWLESEKYVPCR